MAWGWSHTGEALEAARANLEELSRDDLEVIYAEWRASRRGESGFDSEFNHREYNRALKQARGLSVEALAESIWERAESLAVCENGGFEAWMCPYGCAVHCVPFNREGNKDE